jgi:hypothetical protein
VSSVGTPYGGDGSGKGTCDSAQLRAGDVHPDPDLTLSLPWPHLPYGDAVAAGLAAAGLAPDAVEVGCRQRRRERELYVRAVWLPGHDALTDGMRQDGMTLTWSHLGGWAAAGGPGGLTLRELWMLPLAAPPVVVEAAVHLLRDGIDAEWKPDDWLARWDRATELDAALIAFDEREGMTW